MAFDNFSTFITELADSGELVRTSAEVDVDLEVAEIARRAARRPDGGPALLFDNVRKFSTPLAVNVLGSEPRICRALRADSFDEVAARLVDLIRPDVPENWLEAVRLFPRFAQLTRVPPRSVRTGICQQVVKLGGDVNLGELPIPRIWPDEPGPTLTFGQVHTLDPETGARHAGVTPLLVTGRDKLSVYWTRFDAGWQDFERVRESRRQMPVAIVLGADPALAFVAQSPLPPFADPCLLAGCLRNQPIDLVAGRQIAMEVPADAEFVIEGHIDTALPLVDAPSIAGETGHYTLPRAVPTMHVSAITHRANPIFPAHIRSAPAEGNDWLAIAVERIFLPFMRLYVPEIVDLHRPAAGSARNILFVSLRKQFPRQAWKVANALWGYGPLMTTKIIVIVDDDVDVRDEALVWHRVGTNVHPGRDLFSCEGPTHAFDHAAPIDGLGHKLAIDATRKSAGEGHPRPWPNALASDATIADLVQRRWSEFGLGPDTEPA